MSTPARWPLSKALATMLEAGTARPCGLGQRPRTADGAEPKMPYGVVYPQPGSSYDGAPLGHDHADAVWTYQVDCVAKTVEQALALADRVMTTMVARTEGGQAYVHELAADDLRVLLRRFTDDNGPELVDGLVTLSQRFAVHVTRPDDA